MTPGIGQRCREIAQRAALQDGFELAAQWVEELAATPRGPADA
jgi:hypothetical protein